MDSRLKIRPAKPSDAEELLAIYAPYVKETAITFEYEVPTLDEFRARIAHTLEKYPYLVAEFDGAACGSGAAAAGSTIAGYCYAGAFKNRAAYDWAVETTVYVRKGSRRSGVGKGLYKALEASLQAMGILNMDACIAYIDDDDEYLTGGSVAFHRSMGFSMVGRFRACGYKFDRWYDMVWMEKLIGEHGKSQPMPRKFSEISDELFCGNPS